MIYKQNISLIFVSIITACTAPASANNIYRQELQAFKKHKIDLFYDGDSLASDILRHSKKAFQHYKVQGYGQSWALWGLNKIGIMTSQEDFPKLHAYIANICQKANMEMPAIFICTYLGFLNAGAIRLFNSAGGIIIGQEMFNYPDEEIEAIITHELGHIKHHHTNKRMAWCLLSLTITHCYHVYLLDNYLSESWQEKSRRILSFILTQCIINKFYEIQADQFAFQHRKAQGLSDFLNHFIDQEQQDQDDFKELYNNITNSKKEVSELIYYCNMMPLYYASKLGYYFEKSCKWLYYYTPLGDHPSNEARVKAAQDYIDAHAS